MAARIDRIHSERVRQRIRISQLVTRLQNNALGRNGVVMTPAQIDSAKFLIGKALADLPKQTEISGPEGGALPLSLGVEYVSKDDTAT